MCGYCEITPNAELRCDLMVHGEYSSFKIIKKEFQKIEYLNRIGSDLKINYCPMCGRRLENGRTNK